MRIAILLAVLVAACDPPQPSIQLEYSSGPAQACPSASCDGIPMTCRMFMGVRIIDPADRSAPFHFECLEIPRTRTNICQIGGLDLQPHELPYRDLEVQIAVYPEEMVTPDPISPDLWICPSDTTYDAVNGFPIPGDHTPALGGRGYYRPGDDVINVTLGCADLGSLANDQCEGVASVTVTATVDDFDTHLSVSQTQAERLSVNVGQPKPASGGFALNNVDLTPLMDTPATAPAWSGTVDELFTTHACLTVLDDTPQSTTSVTCKKAKITDSMIQLAGASAGVRLTKSSLDQILAALSLTAFPLEGMTIGVVVDGGTPVAGQVVDGQGATIEYLSADRSSVGGSSTSGGQNGGVFVSRDAPFNTTFTTTRMTPPATAGRIGGRIAGKVTIVVLDLTGGGTQPD